MSPPWRTSVPAASTTANAPRWKDSTISPRQSSTRTGWVMLCSRNGAPILSAFELEDLHDGGQLARLFLQALGRGGGLLDERGVLLRHLVELRHAHVDLADARGLLGAGTGDLLDDVADAVHAVDDALHRAAGLGDELAADLDAFHRGADQRLDLARRIGGALRQAAHLGGHHGEAAALLAGARRLD